MAHRALTPKEAAFVREYLVDLNAKAAAERAKYSKKSAGRIGSEVLNRPWVRKAIQLEMAKRSKRVGLTADEVIDGIRTVVEHCMKRQPMDTHGALKGYELLGKHLKLFTDKVELQGNVTFIVDTGIRR